MSSATMMTMFGLAGAEDATLSAATPGVVRLRSTSPIKESSGGGIRNYQSQQPETKKDQALRWRGEGPFEADAGLRKSKSVARLPAFPGALRYHAAIGERMRVFH